MDAQWFRIGARVRAVSTWSVYVQPSCTVELNTLVSYNYGNRKYILFSS